MLSRESGHRWRRELAVTRLVEELARFAKAPNPIGQFYFWNRTRREIALKFCSILGRDAHVFTPFLAAPVYDLLASLPAEYFLDHEFHTEAIVRNYPEYAHLPFEIKSAPRNRQNWFDLVRWTSQVARYCCSTAGFLSTAGFYVSTFGQRLSRSRLWLASAELVDNATLFGAIGAHGK